MFFSDAWGKGGIYDSEMLREGDGERERKRE